MIPVLILAAGTSTRMRGADKLLQDVGGVPLLQAQTRKALATGHPVYVALPEHAPARQAAIGDLPAIPLQVPEASQGLAGTLRGAFGQIGGTGAMMILLADLVALTTADLQQVIAAFHNCPDKLVWRGATAGGKPGHPIIISGQMRPAFSRLAGDRGGADILAQVADQTHLVPLPDMNALHDLDTPEDWAAWRASIS